jgi:hypothetical protein
MGSRCLKMEISIPWGVSQALESLSQAISDVLAWVERLVLLGWSFALCEAANS